MHARGCRKRGKPKKMTKGMMMKEEKDSVTYKGLQAKVKELEEENKRLSALLSRYPYPDNSFGSSSSPPSSSPASSSSSSSSTASASSSFIPPVVTVKKQKLTKNITCSPQRMVALLVTCLCEDPFKVCQGSGPGPSLRLALLKALQTMSLVDNVTLCDLQGCSKSSSQEVTETGKHPFEVVVTVRVRSRVMKIHSTPAMEVKTEPEGGLDPKEECEGDLSQEFNYPAILNEALPMEIRVLAWCPVPEGFSLPNSSSLNTFHTYKYFFPQGSLNVEVMNAKAQQIVGEHLVPPQCREVARINVAICEPDTKLRQDPRLPSQGNSSHMYIRCREAESTQGTPNTSPQDMAALVGAAGYQMCVMTLTGRGFTWADVQRVVAALLNVGKKNEEEGSQLSMEDILQSHHLTPASEVPLHIFHTKLEGKWQWVWDRQALTIVITQLQQHWEQHAVRSAAARTFLQDYETVLTEFMGTKDLPHSQCQNQTGQKIVNHLSSFSTAPTDHEYSAMMEKDRVGEGTHREDNGYDSSLMSLLVQLMGPLVHQLMGGVGAQGVAFHELQSQMARLGVPISLVTVAQIWRDLLTLYNKARQQQLAGERVKWKQFKILDSMLSRYDLSSLPSKVTTQSQLASDSVSCSKVTIKQILSKSTSEKMGEEEEAEVQWGAEKREEVIQWGVEEGGEEVQWEVEKGEEEMQWGVEEKEKEMVLLVEASPDSLSYKESFKEYYESSVSSPASISHSGEMEDYTGRSESHLLSSPGQPSPFPSVPTVEENKDCKIRATIFPLGDTRRKKERTVQFNRVSSSKETAGEVEEERKQRMKKEKLIDHSYSSRVLLHHDNDAVFAIETGNQQTTDPTEIFLEYQLHRGREQRGRLDEYIHYLAQRNTKRGEYRKKREELEEESLTALREIDAACHTLKTELMEV